jgi:hypothetical protein
MSHPFWRIRRSLTLSACTPGEGDGVPSRNHTENSPSTSTEGVKRLFVLMHRHHLPRWGVFWSFCLIIFFALLLWWTNRLKSPHPGSVGGNGGGFVRRGAARPFRPGGRVPAAARRGEGTSCDCDGNKLRAAAAAAATSCGRQRR